VRLTDAVSVKVAVADAVAQYAPRARFVGGHPMAGTSASGWAAGSAGLFDGAAWVVAADEHDLAVARISHLPHLFAAVLAAVGAEGGPLALSLAAGSFGDGTRVAGTRPELVLAMCEGNRDALLAAVDDALGRLGAMRGALASTGGLAATVRAGHDGRTRWAAAQGPEGVRVRLSGRAPLARLRDVGRAGKTVTGWA